MDKERAMRSSIRLPTHEPPRSATGFTLVETLVAIGVIGILLGILLPALRGVRDSAREAVCLSNLRGLAQTFEVYTQVHKGAYPWTPMAPNIKLYMFRGVKNFVHGIQFDATSMVNQWPAVVQEVAPLAEHAASWVCPGSPRRKDGPWCRIPERDPEGLAVNPSSYFYSRAFVGDPRLWSADAPTTEAEQRALYRPVRVDEVVFPAAKTLLYDEERSHISPSRRTPAMLDATPMVFADGHAQTLRISRAAEPFYLGRRGQGMRLVDTPNGV
ncbi:MAG: prepilin-type N-terminal cleavage/methylation domain-containing protein, partial [Planctomycetota bacterium]